MRDPVSKRLKRAVVRQAAAMTAQNADMRDRLIGLGAAPDRVFTQPVGARVGQMRDVSAAEPQVPGRVVFVGRLVEKKGVTVLLAALRQMPQDVAWSLEVIGDGPLRPQLELLADGLPVTFRGQRGGEEVARAFGRAEVVVVPSVPAASGDQDGLPLVLLEAMAAGRATVASRLPGLDEVIEDECSGLLVEHSEPDLQAKALERLLRDLQLRARLGQAAAMRAESYSVEAVGARFVEILGRLAAHQDPGG